MTTHSITLHDFTDISDKKKLMVLNWRNNLNIRHWMYHFDTISTDEHLSFIESLKTDQTKQYYLVLQDNNPIGVIYFTNMQDRCAEFGLYANPHLRGNGKTLMKTICQYAFTNLKLNKLYAEVFKDNRKAIDLYHYFGLQTIDSKQLNNKNIICMELKNENKQL